MTERLKFFEIQLPTYNGTIGTIEHRCTVEATNEEAVLKALNGQSATIQELDEYLDDIDFSLPSMTAEMREYLQKYGTVSDGSRVLNVGDHAIHLTANAAKWLIEKGAVNECGDKGHAHDLHLAEDDDFFFFDSNENLENFVLAIAGKL